jgi:hypothetical protein
MKKIIQLSAVVLLCLAGNAWGQVQYTVTDLGTLPGGGAVYPYGINDSGQVVGVRAPPSWLNWQVAVFEGRAARRIWNLEVNVGLDAAVQP